MSVERDVLASALKLTKEHSAKIGEIGLDARVAAQIVYRILKRNSETEIVGLQGRTVVMNGEQRIRAAIRIVELGGDLERVSRLLEWDEFEDVSALAFENNSFSVKKHYRFKSLGKRWEIDILALKNPIVVSVDCKHWQKGWRGSSVAKIASSHIARTQALSEASPLLREKIGIQRWKEARFVPVILSLTPSDLKFHEEVPIVPILQVRSFLEGMPAYLYSLKHFSQVYLE